MKEQAYLQITTGKIIHWEDFKFHALMELLTNERLFKEIQAFLIEDGRLDYPTRCDICNYACHNIEEVMDWIYSGNYIKIMIDGEGNIINEE